MPGGKEKFVVTVKTKNTNVAAEIMTSMYDASLDKIEKHEWRLPYFRNDFDIDNSWDNSANENTSNEWNNPIYFSKKSWRGGKIVEPLYWLNPMDYAYSELSENKKNRYQLDEDGKESFRLEGRVAGVNIINTEGLNEVVVSGVNIARKSLSMSTVTTVLRGISSLNRVEKSIVILDGIVYKGDVSKINAGNIIDAILLKGADATSLYGSEAANGVLILSTKGPIVLPLTPPPPTVVRKNFSETAFFFPQVHADEEGFYNFEFTMPESVTEWKWKIFAHTKDANFSQTEKTIFTQLPLMVQPNMPRFLYQGDKIVLQSRITNLDSTNISGISYCTIEDAVTGENITAQLSKNVQQDFDVQKKSNSNVAYTITVPENLLHPIKIKITAKAGSFSDGEEHTIPILSKKILVVQNQQIVFSKSDTIVNTIALPSDASPYGISLYIAPKPEAAVINALPYMAFYEHNCAEQTFNKLLAHSMATQIMRTDVNMQKMQKVKQIGRAHV